MFFVSLNDDVCVVHHHRIIVPLSKKESRFVSSHEFSGSGFASLRFCFLSLCYCQVLGDLRVAVVDTVGLIKEEIMFVKKSWLLYSLQ